MGERRFGRGQFLVAWAVLVALQCLAFFPVIAQLGVVAQVVWVVALQLAKLPITWWRLNDTGRDPSDAALYLLPIVGVGAFLSRMLEAPPSEKVRERRRAQWVGRLGPMGAIGEGARLVAKTLPLGLPLTALFAAVSALGGHWVLSRLDWAQQVDASTLATTIQALWAVAGFLGLYTALQVMKRKTATRKSWAPSLLLAPTILLAGGFSLLQNGMGQQLGLLVLSMLLIAWNLAWGSLGGAALAVGQVVLGDRARRDESTSAGELVSTIAGRTLDVAGPHGARHHAVSIGMQVVLPGIFYALQLAFVDMIAVLRPEEPALARSGRLTWGMRSRLFKVFLIWFLVSMGLSTGIALAIEGPAAAQASFFDPRALQTSTFFLQELTWALLGWVLEMAMLALYVDRVAQEAARTEAAAKAAPAVAAPVGDV